MISGGARSGVGDVEAGLAAAAAVVDGTWRTTRVAHTALETHASVAWLDDDGRLVVRTSTQVPFLVRNELARILALPPERVRVLTARVGGGFGGKQELLTEDLVGLAVLRTGRPVQSSTRARTSSRRRRAGTRCGCRCASARPRTGCSPRCDRRAHRCRCVRQPLARRHVPRMPRVDGALPVPEQAGRRRLGLHEQAAVGRVPWIRAGPAAVRDRERAGRTRAQAGDGPVRAAPPQRDRAGGRAITDRSCPTTRGRRLLRPSEQVPRLAQEALRLDTRRWTACWQVGDGMAAAMIATIPPRGHHAEASATLARTARTSCAWAPPSSATAPRRCTPDRGSGARTDRGSRDRQPRREPWAMHGASALRVARCRRRSSRATFGSAKDDPRRLAGWPLRSRATRPTAGSARRVCSAVTGSSGSPRSPRRSATPQSSKGRTG